MPNFRLLKVKNWSCLDRENKLSDLRKNPLLKKLAAFTFAVEDNDGTKQLDICKGM